MGFWDSIFAPGEAEKSAELDAQLDRLNKDALDRHRIEQAEYERRRLAIEAGAMTGGEVDQAFVDGFKEAAQTRQNQIKTVLTAPVNWALGVIPWWGWVALVGAAFWYLGGVPIAKAWLKTYAKGGRR